MPSGGLPEIFRGEWVFGTQWFEDGELSKINISGLNEKHIILVSFKKNIFFYEREKFNLKISKTSLMFLKQKRNRFLTNKSFKLNISFTSLYRKKLEKWTSIYF